MSVCMTAAVSFHYPLGVMKNKKRQAPKFRFDELEMHTFHLWSQLFIQYEAFKSEEVDNAMLQPTPEKPSVSCKYTGRWD